MSSGNGCSYLSAAQAATITGKPYTTATPTTIATGQDQCDYGDAADDAFTTIVYQPNSGITWAIMLSVLNQTAVGGHGATILHGIGDNAAVGSLELDAQFGDHYVAVEDTGIDLTSSYTVDEKIASTIGAALPG